MSRIIVVDDDQGTTSLVKMLLEMEGYSVATFNSVQSVLEEAGNGVSAFIIDCYLGKKASGIDLLRSVRVHHNRAVKEAPVIMVSGDGRVESEARAAGADHFMLKPYSPNDLSREVKALIEGRASRRQEQE
ncbi:MAG TPA: response regulator [Candidatus Sulfomarinibacteraceae bacterium]|nr:response regulator [Candidatus Sulfomarinibacteraceae bacterium]